MPYQQPTSEGRFARRDAGFRNIISADNQEFPPEFGRYHLYISFACPWANRAYAVLKMKGLDDCIGVSVVHPTWQRTRINDSEDEHCGWTFETGALPSHNGHGSYEVPLCTGDPINGAKFIRDLYEMSNDTHKLYSVPVLWDKKNKCIVNNESSEIIRMFNSEFNQWAKGPYASIDLYPAELRAAIEEANGWIYPTINNGVYRCGFAKTQEAYNEAVDALFNSLDRLELLLSQSRYVVGDKFTEADIRLFMTLVRFDEVYNCLFKCNVKRITDYHNIHNYCRELHQMPFLTNCTQMAHIKTHYYTSLTTLNQFAIVPKGRDSLQGFLLPHDRANINNGSK